MPIINLQSNSMKMQKRQRKMQLRLPKGFLGGVQEAFVMEKRMEVETRALATVILQFGRQTDQWLAASHAINTAIKEIGDFENWMKSMEFDCKSINAAICNIHQA